MNLNTSTDSIAHRSPDVNSQGVQVVQILTESERLLFDAVLRLQGTAHCRLLSRLLKWHPEKVRRTVNSLHGRGFLYKAPCRPVRSPGRRPIPLYANSRELAAAEKATGVCQTCVKPSVSHRSLPDSDTAIRPPETRLQSMCQINGVGNAHSNPLPEQDTARFDAASYPKDQDSYSPSREKSVGKYQAGTVPSDGEEKTGNRFMREGSEAVISWVLSRGIPGNTNGRPIDQFVAGRVLNRRGITLSDFKLAWKGYESTSWTNNKTFAGCIADFDHWIKVGQEAVMTKLEVARKRQKRAERQAKFHAERIAEDEIEFARFQVPVKTEREKVEAALADARSQLERCPPVLTDTEIEALVVSRGFDLVAVRRTNAVRRQAIEAVRRTISALEINLR